MESTLKALERIQAAIQTSVPSSSRTPPPPSVPREPKRIDNHLYEIHKPEGTPSVEFIFFHGLQWKRSKDAYLTTWMSEGGSEVWLYWLLKPFPKARIITVAYDASTRETGTEGRMDSFATCENLVSSLTKGDAPVGQDGCPVVLVGHCLGGIVMKHLCIWANRSLGLNPTDEPDKSIENLLKNIRGFFFYGTPHNGSKVVDNSTGFSKGPLFEILETLNTETARSNEDFRKLRTKFHWKTAGIGETRITDLGEFKGFVSMEGSARLDMDDFYTIDADHFTVCRPKSMTSNSFSNLSNFVRRFLEEVQLGSSSPNKPLKIADGGPQRLTGRVTNDGLMEGNGGQTSVPLPFYHDHKYVPISESIKDIQKALEDEAGKAVVTVYGAPGLGKSSAVKYVAMHYQEERKRWLTTAEVTFPDGIYYLFCGREGRVQELKPKLMECLAFGLGFAPPPTDPSTGGVDGLGQDIPLRLLSRLAEQKLLIVVDDVWDRVVFQHLFVRGVRGIKYLIASQNKEVWGDAEKIQLATPSMSEARQILVNYTAKLDPKAKFPDDIQEVLLRLEDRSLVKLHNIREDKFTVSVHSLRVHYIRQKKTWDVKSIASRILASNDEGVELIRRGEAEGTLVAILSAYYSGQPFRDAVANTFRRHLQIINDGVIHRSINNRDFPIDALLPGLPGVYRLVWLLNVDEEELYWKKEAHVYAKRIIIKLACQGKIDDHSMARLLQLPQTSSQASETLDTIWKEMLHDGENNSFSSMHGDTMQTLLGIVEGNAASVTSRAAACRPLFIALALESRDFIVNVAAKLMEVLAMDSNPTVQLALLDGLTPRGRGAITRGVLEMGQHTKLLEVVFELLISNKDPEVRISAGATLNWFCMWKCTALKIAAIPDVLEQLFNLFISEESLEEFRFRRLLVDQSISLVAGGILGGLSCIPENRINWLAIQGGLERLGDIVAKYDGTWLNSRKKKDRLKFQKRASTAAGILAELELENEIRETIASLPGLEEGLLALQVIEMARPRGSMFLSPVNSTRALIFYPNDSDLPPTKLMLEVRSHHRGPQFTESSLARAFFDTYWTRLVAHIEIGAYRAAFENWQLVQRILDRMPKSMHVPVVNRWYSHNNDAYLASMTDLRITQIFLQATLEDYAGALLSANSILDNVLWFGNGQFDTSSFRALILTQRGIVKRLSKDLREALDDFNEAHRTIYEDEYDLYYGLVKHRGLVKHLMGDDVGAMEDAEAAQQLKLKYVVVEETDHKNKIWRLEDQPVNYLGYFL